MNNNADLLATFINEDFGLTTKEISKWGKAIEHNSLILDKERGLFFWNSEGLAGGPIDYLCKVRKMSFADAQKYVKGYNAPPLFFVSETKPVVQYSPLIEVFNDSGKKHREYWYKRLLTDDTIDRFKLGYFNGWYCVPIMDGTNLINFQMRRDEPEKRIKPWYKGVEPTLFNGDLLKIISSVIITEGTVDAILLNQMGFPAISHTRGANWNNDWFYRFINVDSIYYVADNDKVGILAGIKVAQSLGMYRTKILVFEGYKDKYDTVDFFRDGGSIETFRDLLYNKSKFSFELKE